MCSSGAASSLLSPNLLQILLECLSPLGLEQFPTACSVLGRWGGRVLPPSPPSKILPRMRHIGQKKALPFPLPGLIPVGAAWDSLPGSSRAGSQPAGVRTGPCSCRMDVFPSPSSHDFSGVFPTHFRCCSALEFRNFPLPCSVPGSGLAAASLEASLEQVVMEHKGLRWPCHLPVPVLSLCPTGCGVFLSPQGTCPPRLGRFGTNPRKNPWNGGSSLHSPPLCVWNQFQRLHQCQIHVLCSAAPQIKGE